MDPGSGRVRSKSARPACKSPATPGGSALELETLKLLGRMIGNSVELVELLMEFDTLLKIDLLDTEWTELEFDSAMLINAVISELSIHLMDPQKGLEAVVGACGEAQGSRRTLLFHPRRTGRSARRYSRGPRSGRRTPWRQTTGPRRHARRHATGRGPDDAQHIAMSWSQAAGLDQRGGNGGGEKEGPGGGRSL
ncbi:hypothetical protein WDU94_003341 [Cyamophila willieti]